MVRFSDFKTSNSALQNIKNYLYWKFEETPTLRPENSKNQNLRTHVAELVS